METFPADISKVESPQLRLLFEQLYKLLETKDRVITDLNKPGTAQVGAISKVQK